MLDDISKQAAQQLAAHDNEKHMVLGEFEDLLKNNFSFENINHLNTFIKVISILKNIGKKFFYIKKQNNTLQEN